MVGEVAEYQVQVYKFKNVAQQTAAHALRSIVCTFSHMKGNRSGHNEFGAEMYVMQLLLALALTGVLVNLKFKKIQSER